MSNPLKGLKDLVSGTPSASTGSVVEDKGSILLVSTAQGVKEIPKVGGASYAQGDTVRMFNGVAVGHINKDTDLPTYYV